MRYFRQPCAATPRAWSRLGLLAQINLCCLLVHGTASALYGDEAQAIAVHVGAAGLAAGLPADAAAQQIAQQYRPTLDAELAFVRQICGEIPIAQRKAIKAAGEVALQDAADRMAGQQRQPGRLTRQKLAATNPVTIIRNALDRAVNETVSQGVSQHYRDEAARRIAIRKRAAIGNVVARLDVLLCLNEQQRIDIADSLAENWDVSGENWARFSFPGSYAPQIANQHLKCLSPDQRSLWSGLQKIDFAMGAPNGADPPPDDGWWNGKGTEDFYEDVSPDVRVLRLLKLKLE
jgi:hypothetical protein